MKNVKVLECKTAGIISINSKTCFGSWQFDVFKGADANDLKVYFASSDKSLTVGYSLVLSSTESVILRKGASTALATTAASYIANNTWYRIKITRTTAGMFLIYIKGGAFGTNWTLVSTSGGSGTNPVTDTTYTISNYFVADLDAGDRIANISIKEAIEVPVVYMPPSISMLGTVQIGTQIWTVKNLNINVLPNGTTIPIVTDTNIWTSLETAACCWYDNNQATYGEYGMLYNWYAIQMINAAFNPLGFAVPTQAQFDTLITTLGGSTVAGGKMKEAGTTHWAAGNTGNNSSGFTAFGNGNRIGSNGSFSDIYYGAYYINSTEVNSTNCYRIYIPYTGSLLYSASITKKTGGAIRLIKI